MHSVIVRAEPLNLSERDEAEETGERLFGNVHLDVVLYVGLAAKLLAAEVALEDLFALVEVFVVCS